MVYTAHIMSFFPSNPAIIALPSLGFWGDPEENGSILSHVSDGLRRIDLARPSFFPNLRSESDLVLASDYSGEHPESAYHILSCLITDWPSIRSWEPERQRIRQKWLGDGRRLAFKKLGDRQRTQALPAFVESMNLLNGVVLSVAVSKSVGPIFARPGVSRDPLCSRWKGPVLEKVLRITHILGLLLAGLARPLQNVLWFTDDDAMAATHYHLRDLSEALMRVSSAYLRYSLGHLRCTTTGIQADKTRLVEDLVAIPDLVAGTFGAYISALRTGHPSSPDLRYTPILKWISAPKTSVACVFVTIESAPGRRYGIQVLTLGSH